MYCFIDKFGCLQSGSQPHHTKLTRVESLGGGCQSLLSSIINCWVSEMALRNSASVDGLVRVSGVRFYVVPQQNLLSRTTVNLIFLVERKLHAQSSFFRECSYAPQYFGNNQHLQMIGYLTLGKYSNTCSRKMCYCAALCCSRFCSFGKLGKLGGLVRKRVVNNVFVEIEIEQAEGIEKEGWHAALVLSSRLRWSIKESFVAVVCRLGANRLLWSDDLCSVPPWRYHLLSCSHTNTP